MVQTGSVAERLLPGGFVNRVVQVGDTVRRNPGDRAEFVHELLRHFEQCGWLGAPRLLGVDGQGREILTFIDGYVAWRSPADRVDSAESLTAVARLVRQFHDLTAGTPPAGDQEVVCHSDLSPKNTVYRDGGEGMRPVAFLDWDLAAPGARIHDVAHMCWQYLDLGPAVQDLATTSNRLRLMCDAYGLVDRSQIVDALLWWQDRCWRGIESGAQSGDAAMTALQASGAAGSVRAAYDWVLAHRAEMEAALA
jgi:phosphotransferase family enzyme